MSEATPERAVIDTSVVIGLEHLDPDRLPVDLAVSTVTLAELAAGPHVTAKPDVRARRQERLQRAEAVFDALPVDVDVARAYGRIYGAVAAAGQKPRGRRALDLLIAATALANGLPLYTRNPGDFNALAGIVDVVPVETAP